MAPYELNKKTFLKIIVLSCCPVLSYTAPFLGQILACNKMWNVRAFWWISKALPKAKPTPEKGPAHWWNSKTLLKAKLAPEKGPAHCLEVSCQSSSLQVSESPWDHYVWELLSKLMKCTGNCDACFPQQEGPSSAQHLTTCHTANTSKVEGIELWRVPNLQHLHDHSPTNHHFFKHLDNFFWVKLFPNQQDTRIHWIWNMDFCAQEQTTYTLLAKMYWMEWLLICLIEMYLNNDLKSVVWNCDNYFCINLIGRRQEVENIVFLWSHRWTVKLLFTLASGSIHTS